MSVADLTPHSTPKSGQVVIQCYLETNGVGSRSDATIVIEEFDCCCTFFCCNSKTILISKNKPMYRHVPRISKCPYIYQFVHMFAWKKVSLIIKMSCRRLVGHDNHKIGCLVCLFLWWFFIYGFIFEAMTDHKKGVLEHSNFFQFFPSQHACFA